LPSYHETVAGAWAKQTQVTNPLLRLHTTPKLQCTGRALRSWGEGVIGQNKLMLRATSQLIGILDVVQDFRQLTDQEILLKRVLKTRFLGLTAVEKLRAKQK
jgi:hypothetical protein